MNGQSDVVVSKTCAALTAGQGDLAIRELLTGASHGVVPTRGDLMAWMKENLGASAAAAVIRAFAAHACYYCKNGLQSCELCEGLGHFDSTLCDHCLGLGICSCDFCNGTGLVTYNIVPVSIRAKVIEARMKAALNQAEQLMKKSPAVDPKMPIKQIRRLLAGRLFSFDRVMGILENALLAAREISKNRKEARLFAAKVIRQCRRLALGIDSRMRATLKRMAALEQAEAAAARKAAAGHLPQQRAQLYKNLQKNRGFRGTTLRHPFLKVGPSKC